MRKLATLWALFLVVSLIAGVAGCTKPKATPTLTPTPVSTTPLPISTPTPTPLVVTQTPTSTPSAGPTGELKVAVSSLQLEIFDPQLFGSIEGRLYGYLMYDTLIGVSSDGDLGPGIAERWEMSPDGMTWTFFIRKGVKFHDGSDLTGADVKFTLERNMLPEAAGSDAANLRQWIDRVELINAYTVAVYLKQPRGELWPGMVVHRSSKGAIVPKKYIEEKGVEYFREHPIGSGPYKFVKLERGNYIEFEAVGNWRAMPQFKTVKLMAVPELANRIAMLKTKAVDMAEISAEATPEIKAAGLRVFSSQAGEMSGMAFYYDVANPEKHPVGDARVRAALSLAINRQEMADKLFQGYAKPAALLNVPPTAYYYDPNVVKPDPFDLQEAKRLLAEAGYASGFDIKMYSVPVNPFGPIVTEAVAGYWRSIGVRATIVPMEWAAYRPMWTRRSPEIYSGTTMAWGASSGPILDFRTAFHSKGPHANTKNTKLDDLIDQAETALDLAERKRLALEALVEAQKERAVIGLFVFEATWAVGPKVGGWTPFLGIASLSLNLPTVTRGQ